MLKTILMSAVVALTVAACAHNHSGKSCCGKDKATCSDSKECPLPGKGTKAEAECAHCKGEEKAATGK